MNSDQVHLMLNHVPSIGEIIGCILFMLGYVFQNNPLKIISAYVILCSALFVIPVNRSGEMAEDRIEAIVGVTHHDIHEHEEAAGPAFVITLLSALVALGFIITQKMKPELSNYFGIALFIASIGAIVFLIRVSHLGGIIRHPELRSHEARAHFQEFVQQKT